MKAKKIMAKKGQIQEQEQEQAESIHTDLTSRFPNLISTRSTD